MRYRDRHVTKSRPLLMTGRTVNCEPASLADVMLKTELAVVCSIVAAKCDFVDVRVP